VSFAAPADWKAFDTALGGIGEFDWILLTSQNAVRFLAERCGELRIDLKSLQAPQSSQWAK
jgi:uroporphyrinogen-III synthase